MSRAGSGGRAFVDEEVGSSWVKCCWAVGGVDASRRVRTGPETWRDRVRESDEEEQRSSRRMGQGAVHDGKANVGRTMDRRTGGALLGVGGPQWRPAGSIYGQQPIPRA